MASTGSDDKTGMIRLQVPLQQPCYDFSFLQTLGFAGLPRAVSGRVRATHQSVRVGRSDGRCVQKTGTQSARGRQARLLDIPRSRGTVPTPDPYHGGGSNGWPGLSAGLRSGAVSVVRVRPRVSKGITDLLGRPRSSGSAPALPPLVGAVVSLVNAIRQTVYTTN